MNGMSVDVIVYLEGFVDLAEDLVEAEDVAV